MKKILKFVPFLVIAVLVGVTIAYAGSLTPPGAVEDTMYSLEDIYNLASDTTTTEGSGEIPATPGSVSATGKTDPPNEVKKTGGQIAMEKIARIKELNKKKNDVFLIC